MDRKVYIIAKGLISVTGHSMDQGFWQGPRLPSTYPWLAIEPSYEGMITANQRRRLSKVVRMGLGAAWMALRDAGLERPDMISTGTSLGCLHDTEQFLIQMVQFQEQKLSPTAFIQSTHNTVGGQIALATGCLGENLCFAQMGHSFEQAFLSTALWLESNPGGKALVGGIDEIRPLHMEIIQHDNLYSKGDGDAQTQYQSPNGNPEGEGAGFFLVSDKPAEKGCPMWVEDLELFNASQAASSIRRWEQRRDAAGETGPDLILSGQAGHPHNHPFYAYLSESLLPTPPIYPFKSITGEFGTASALALGLAHQMGEGKFPDIEGLFPHGFARPRRIWIINEHLNDYSFWDLRLGS